MLIFFIRYSSSICPALYRAGVHASKHRHKMRRVACFNAINRRGLYLRRMNYIFTTIRNSNSSSNCPPFYGLGVNAKQLSRVISSKPGLNCIKRGILNL